MVHLLSRGYVLPVVGYIRKCLEKLNTDISLIRYFVTEVTASSELKITSGLHEWMSILVTDPEILKKKKKKVPKDWQRLKI